MNGQPPSKPPPNDRLREARQRLPSPSGSGRPMSRQELAEAVNAYLWDHHRSIERLDDNDIGKYERGEHRWPSRQRREAFRAVLRATSDTNLGFYVNRGARGAAVSTGGELHAIPPLGVAVGCNLHTAQVARSIPTPVAGTIADLDDADADGLWPVADEINALVGLPDTIESPRERSVIGVREWREATFRWLVRRAADPVGHEGGRHVGVTEVDHLRTMRRVLKEVDDKHGGAVALPLAIALLRGQVALVLRGSYSASTALQLHAVVAQLMLDAGWMAYDAGMYQHSGACMLRALSLTHAVGDRLFGGRVLVAMSHQALQAGQVPTAVDLARAAQLGNAGNTPARAQAMFAAMEAVTLGAAGHSRQAAEALTRAERALSHAERGEDPEWLDFDEGGLWGHAARAQRYLDDGTACVRSAAVAVASCQPAHRRTLAQRQALLASGQLLEGDLEQAASTGLALLGTATTVTSAHVDREIAGLASSVSQRHSRAEICAGFLDQAKTYLRCAAQKSAVNG